MHSHCRNTILEGSNPAVLSVLPGGGEKKTNKKKHLSSRLDCGPQGLGFHTRVCVQIFAFVTNHYVLVKPAPNSKQPHFCDIVHHVALAATNLCLLFLLLNILYFKSLYKTTYTRGFLKK